ncbi:hypothetical protein [Caldicellulosiruptor morganii]|uniref:Uncharacterized protein n=1 Tax=Caldicellulosiruptor morganii TaxID=1387555 RepID=A0ABY7BMY9_9FIRM|nr:hypothetical protein [Caldicellulosiruptor morganii]WAM33944.1 hypothetical protein OTK00_000085 [Caldicellulosiruptor morganii]
MKKYHFYLIAFLTSISLLLTSSQAKAYDVPVFKDETKIVVWLLRGGNLAAPVTQAVTNSVGFRYNQTSSTQRYVTQLDLCIIAHNGRDLFYLTGCWQVLGLTNLSCYRNGSLINSFSGSQLTYGPAIVPSSDLYKYGYRKCNYLYNPITDSWNVQGTTYLYFDAAINSWITFSIYY